jgi:hypothetical protein
MYKYRVVERWAAENRLALRCSRGRYHLTRALNGLPADGISLHGDQPHLGFGILRCEATGAAFRVIFESINHPDRVFGSGPAGEPPGQPSQRGTAPGADD